MINIIINIIISICRKIICMWIELTRNSCCFSGYCCFLPPQFTHMIVRSCLFSHQPAPVHWYVFTRIIRTDFLVTCVPPCLPTSISVEIDNFPVKYLPNIYTYCPLYVILCLACASHHITVLLTTNIRPHQYSFIPDHSCPIHYYFPNSWHTVNFPGHAYAKHTYLYPSAPPSTLLIVFSHQHIPTHPIHLFPTIITFKFIICIHCCIKKCINWWFLSPNNR